MNINARDYLSYLIEENGTTVTKINNIYAVDGVKKNFEVRKFRSVSQISEFVGDLVMTKAVTDIKQVLVLAAKEPDIAIAEIAKFLADKNLPSYVEIAVCDLEGRPATLRK